MYNPDGILRPVNPQEAGLILREHTGMPSVNHDWRYALMTLPYGSDVPGWSVLGDDWDGVYVLQDHKALHIVTYRLPARYVQKVLL